MSNMSKSRFIESPGHKVNPNCLLLHRGQGSIALAVGAGGGCFGKKFFSSIFSLFFSHSLGDGPI